MLSGNQLASFDGTGKVRYGHTACEGTNWKSDSAVQCIAASGIGRTHFVKTTLGIRTETISQTMSYDSTAPRVIRPNNYPTVQSVVLLLHNCTNLTCWNDSCNISSCNTWEYNVVASNSSSNAAVTVSGENMGSSTYSVRVRSGFTQHEYTLWSSDSSLACLSASGIGASANIQVTAGKQTGNTITSLVSYHALEMSTVVGSNRVLPGGPIVFLQGSFLGPSDWSSTSASELSVMHLTR